MRKIRASEPRVWKISRNILGVVLAMMVAGLLFLYARMAQQTMYAESSQYLNEVSLQMAAAIEKHCSSQWTMLDMFYRYLMDMSGGDLEKFQDYAVREQPDWGFETLCLIDENSQYYDRTHTYSLLTYKDVTGRLLTEHNKAIVDNVIYEDENRLIFFMPIEELKINGKDTTVRFLAINAPEYTKTKEPYGKEASAYVCDALKSAETIELEYDDGSDKLDKYGRTLAWVYADDVLLQKELVKKGLAEVKYLYGDYAYTKELQTLEKEAKKEKLNMWSDGLAAEEEHNETIQYVLGAAGGVILIVFGLFFAKGKRNKQRYIRKGVKQLRRK